LTAMESVNNLSAESLPLRLISSSNAGIINRPESKLVKDMICDKLTDPFASAESSFDRSITSK